jgi:hypothetical protein
MTAAKNGQISKQTRGTKNGLRSVADHVLQTRRRFLLQGLAAAFGATLLSGCTKHVRRGAPETRHFEVDWDQLDRQSLDWDGWVIEGVPLTPSQWPLEGSVKSLFAGDFEGVIDRFDLRFHSSTLEGDVLEELYDAGYVPAYVRVANTADSPRRFEPLLLSLEADQRSRLFAVTPEELPATFERTDWGAAGMAVVVATLTLFLVVLSVKEGRGRVHGSMVQFPARVGLEAKGSLYRRGAALPDLIKPDTRGLLLAAEMAPGAQAEGFLFFRIGEPVLDWTSLRLMTP